MTAAEAETKAAALEASALQLRAAGCEEEACNLEKRAAEERKRQTSATLSPGQRLDSQEAFLQRCEKRATKSEEAVAAAQKGLEEAQALRDKALEEVQQAKQKVEQMRKDLAASVVPPGPAAMDVSVAAVDELAEVQRQLAQAREELTTLRGSAAGEPAAGQPAAQMPADVPALQLEVQRLQGALSSAQDEGDMDAYDQAAAAHALTASALARAMRLRSRS